MIKRGERAQIYDLGIDPMVQRDRQDEAVGVIRKLLRGEERFSHESDWFTLKDARLQLLPLQEDLPFAVASMVSPSGMTLAGKHGTGVLSIGSMSTAGLQALPTQWGFAEDSAAKHGNSVSRAYGYGIQGQYDLLSNLQLTARYDEFDPNVDVDNSFDSRWYTLGCNWFIHGQDIKWQTNYTFREEMHGEDIDNDILMTHFQVLF